MDNLKAKNTLQAFSNVINGNLDGIITHILWLFPKSINNLIFGEYPLLS
jgi:hypothetical protein